MEIHVLIVCSVIALGLLPFADCLKCTVNTYYRVKKNGKESCKVCELCIGGGIGWNAKVQRLEDERGFLSCLPCERCAAGTYRKLVSRDSWCRACTLDCNRLNRYWSVRCGGDNEGHCSECLHGYATASKEPNSMCTRSGARSTNDPTTKATTYGPKQHLQSTDIPRPNYANHDVYQQGPSNLHTNLTVWILGFVVLIVGSLIGAFVATRNCCCCAGNKNRKPTDLVKEVDSKDALIASNGTSIGEYNDLEMDGGGDQPNKVRGERPTIISIDEIEAFHIGKDTIHTKVVEKKNRKYRNRRLNKDDSTLTLVAQKVSGERRHELFHTYLKIEIAKTNPEQEKWYQNVISFPDYILNVLKIWLQVYGEDADLQCLVSALRKASFTDVIVGILDLPENQMPPEDNTKGINIVEIEFDTADNNITIPNFPKEEENINGTELIS